ncbi:radical SAM protein [Candidatus Woesearchaeota archaeon]|nr:radical SAM protein [Candidatus Woesearchaeota archaeon]
MVTILDCYTDEPAGLGVPPYLGTYPRYIAGYFRYLDPINHIDYITIDDLRFFKYYNLDEKKKEINHKTNIKIYNLTKNISRIKDILDNTSLLIVILGVHTPGKYLSALPGTLKEVSDLIRDLRCEKILTGPAVFGTQLEGGKFSEKSDLSMFNKIELFDFSYDGIKEYAVKGSDITKQIPNLRIMEIETGHGCSRKKGCSFCTEPIKHSLSFRKKDDILREIKSLYSLGCRHFRLGKQSDFYLYPDAVELLKSIRKSFPAIDVLHIDNVNPKSVVTKKGINLTKAVIKYCTEGNIAAFGVESFDETLVKENNLNCSPEETYEAVKVLNRYGSKRGNNGMPALLPGINILFGLKGENRETHTRNMFWLNKILKENLLLRRINIRQVSIFEGTPLYEECGNKFLRKNRRHYWRWRNEVRQRIDLPMLRRLLPLESILRNARADVYDGNTTFCRQVGTYPLIVGVKGRLELGKFYDFRIKGHMLRSVTGIVEGKNP